jgi:hypothetical protein
MLCKRLRSRNGGRSLRRAWTFRGHQTGSRRGRPTPRQRPQTSFAAPQACKPPCALALDEGLERFADQAGFLLKAGESLGFGDEFVVERERRAHAVVSVRATISSPFDADSNAGFDGAGRTVHVIASQRARSEVAGPMTGSAKQSRRRDRLWIASSPLRGSSQ